jgi:hypothetical protein
MTGTDDERAQSLAEEDEGRAASSEEQRRVDEIWRSVGGEASGTFGPPPLVKLIFTREEWRARSADRSEIYDRQKDPYRAERKRWLEVFRNTTG